MSREQRDAIDAQLRDAPLDLGGDVDEQREIVAQMIEEMPAPEGVTATPGTLGGVPVVDIDVPDADPTRIVLFVPGDAYAIGSATASVALAFDLARRTGARAISLDYRLSLSGLRGGARRGRSGPHARRSVPEGSPRRRAAGQSSAGGWISPVV